MNPPLSGVYVGPDRMDVIDAMERWLGMRHAVQTVFTPWRRDSMDDLFERLLPRIWNAGRVPLLTWEPYLDTETAPDIARRIAAGDFDSYLDDWANRLADWLAGPDEELGADDDRRLYLRLAHEMNGDWYPWSPTVGDSTPEDYIEMWRHVHDALAREGIGADQLQWIWCVNHVDVGTYSAEACYPGDGYVDWVGVDGFNWGRSQDWSDWRAPAAVFEEMFARLQRFDEPLCVPEVGCSSLTADGSDPVRKADWLREAIDYFDDRVGLCCWFNEDKETDWAVFGGRNGTDSTDGYAYYRAYRESMAERDRTATPIDDGAFRGR
jgi:mannan endo-1,4-beta-mannosidase